MFFYTLEMHYTALDRWQRLRHRRSTVFDHIFYSNFLVYSNRQVQNYLLLWICWKSQQFAPPVWAVSAASSMFYRCRWDCKVSCIFLSIVIISSLVGARIVRSLLVELENFNNLVVLLFDEIDISICLWWILNYCCGIEIIVTHCSAGVFIWCCSSRTVVGLCWTHIIGSDALESKFGFFLLLPRTRDETPQTKTETGVSVLTLSFWQSENI